MYFKLLEDCHAEKYGFEVLSMSYIIIHIHFIFGMRKLIDNQDVNIVIEQNDVGSKDIKSCII